MRMQTGNFPNSAHLLKLFGLLFFSISLLNAGCASTSTHAESEPFRDVNISLDNITAIRSQETPLPQNPLSLDEVIKMSLVHSKKMEIALREESIQDDRITGAYSNFLPKVQMSSVWHRRDTDQKMEMTLGPAKQTIIMGEKEVVTGKASLYLPLYTFGLNSSLYTQALKSKEAAEFSTARVEDEVVLEATQAYFTLLEAENYKEVIDKSLELIRSHKKVAQSFFEQGIVTRNDVLSAEVRESEMEQQLLVIENSIAISRSNLNRLLGIDFEHPTRVQPVSEPAQFNVILEQCTSSALKYRPELKQLNKMKEATEAGISAAKASLYPRLSAASGWNWSDDPTQVNKGYWTTDLMLEWTAFAGFGNTAKLSEAKKQLEQVKTREKELLDGIAMQIRISFFNAKQSIAQIEVAKKTCQQAEENLRIVEERYKQNLISSTEVLDAEAQLTRARASLTSAINKSNTAVAELETAIGKNLKEISKE
ncbi:MAG: TolC family protein [Planctomycetota bacterium]